MELYPHQESALKETESFNRVAYYYDMGLGKTFIGSEKMRDLGAKVNLVVCQKSKVQDWIDHFVDNGYESHFKMIYDCTKWDKNDWKALAENPDEPCVLVINYDLIFRRKELFKLHDFTLMLDESSVIQNETAKRSKAILKMKPKNIILLSGTPTSGKYERLWSQLNLLGWSISKDMYYKQYIETKWIENEAGFPMRVVCGYKNVERLKRKLRDHGAVFAKSEDVFNLPEQNFIPFYVPNSRDYKIFMEDCVVTVNSVTEKIVDVAESDFYGTCYKAKPIQLIGNTLLTKLLYARMLCGVYSKTKLEAFEDLLESTNDRLIVFYNFNDELHVLSNLAKNCERSVSIVNGETKDLTAYQNNKSSVTFVQYQAGAMGLNLQKANKIIYFSPPLSSELYEQSKKRIHRIGQEKSCFYYNLIVKGSVEEKIYETLAMRKDYTDDLFKMED